MVRAIFIVLLLAFMTSGCITLYAHLTYEFNNSEIDKRIYYESGAEDLADLIAQRLSQSVETVENNEYIKFKDIHSTKIYVFNSVERYSKFSNSSIKSRGSATTNEIYLSPKLRENKDAVSRILIHELSHLHIRQYIGTWQYVKNVPGWFHEGLAVKTSNGGGVGKISEEDAIEAIKKGHHFIPVEKGSIFGHKTAHNYGLKPHMYYRQASMFIEFLQKLDEQAFQKSYLGLIQGEEFKEVWKKYYDKPLLELWIQFLKNFQT